MTDEEPHFVLADSFSYLNKGDAGIILGMIQDIEQRFENPSFTIVSETPVIDRERYPKNTSTIDSPFRRVYQKETLLNKLFLFGFTFVILFWGVLYRIARGYLPCPGELDIVEEYSKANAILISGGDKYYDYSDGIRSAISGLPKLFEGVLALALGKRLMIYAHSGGPFKNRYRRKLLKLYFDRIDVITVREPVSEEYFREMNANPKLTADSAFLAPDGDEQAAWEKLAANGIDKNKPIAGFTVRGWHFPESSRDHSQQYKDGIVEVGDFLRDEGFQVVIFPQVIGPNTDDRVISREIAAEIDDVVVLEEDYDVPLLRELIGQCDIFVGTRMHSNIFSVSKGVPTVAIAYRHKTNGIMQMLDLKEYVVDISDTEAELLDSVENLLEHRVEIANSLSSSISEIEQQSSKNSRLLMHLVES